MTANDPKRTVRMDKLGKLIFIITAMYSNASFSCSCSGISFQNTVENSEFVSHLKIVNLISYYDELYMDKTMTEEERYSTSKPELEKLFGEDFIVTVKADVIKKIRGTDLEKQILIVLNDGCPSSFAIFDFELGNEYIVAFKDITENKYQYKRELHKAEKMYALSICAYPVAAVRNNEIHDYKWMSSFMEKDKTNYFMTYDEFIDKFGS